MEKSIICVGKGGLGRAFERKGIVCLGKNNLDITDIGAINSVFRIYKPKYIINCAAIVGVDKCNSNREDSYKINVSGAINLAGYCSRNNCKLIHISTVYSNGSGIYADTKKISESAVLNINLNNLVIRLPWLFGREVNNYILEAINNKCVDIYENEFGYLAHDNDVVEFVLNNLSLSGVFNIANEGFIDRKEILDYFEAEYKLISRSSIMNETILINYYMRNWKTAITEVLNELRAVQPSR